MANQTEKIIDDLIDRYLDEQRTIADTTLHFAFELCDSEIEKIMLAALYLSGFSYTDPPHIISPPDQQIKPLFEKLLIVPQHRAGPYKIDFGLYFSFPSEDTPVKIAVECDGHEFHEKTKQQAARDKRRDRELTKMGWSVVRFTGSEVFNDPKKCIAEIEDIYSSLSDKQKDVIQATIDVTHDSDFDELD